MGSIPAQTFEGFMLWRIVEQDLSVSVFAMDWDEEDE